MPSKSEGTISPPDGGPTAIPLATEAYKKAGVDRDLAERIKGSLGSIAAATSGPQVLGGVGGFGGLFKLSGYRQPVLVSSTDGVGTKLLLGGWTGRYENLGIDLVNACLNDVVVTGADPLFFLDYLAAGVVEPNVIESLVRGMAGACAEAGCALIGGETAEMPGIYGEGEFDMAGFVVGAVEADAMLDPATAQPGDVLIGLPSSGIHTNGFSLIRRVFGLDSDQAVLDRHYPELGRTLGEELSEPHRSYVGDVGKIRTLVKSLAHITGGGLVDNVPRALPDGVGARFDKDAWKVPPIFDLIQVTGEATGLEISDREMHRVFNMGLGMVAVCDPTEADAVVAAVQGASVVGEVIGLSNDAPAGSRVVFGGSGQTA